MGKVGRRSSVEFTAPKRFAAHSGSLGIAALNHEIIDYPVKNETVVIALFSKTGKIFNAFFSLFREKLDLYVAVILYSHNDNFLALFRRSEIHKLAAGLLRGGFTVRTRRLVRR